jgi:hypothetical protein
LATVRTPCSWPPPSVRSLSPEQPLHEIASCSTMPIPIPMINPLFLSSTFAVAYHFNASPKDMLPNRPLQIIFSNTISLFKTNNTLFLIPNHIGRSLLAVSSHIIISSNTISLFKTNSISLLIPNLIGRSLQVISSNIILFPNTNYISSLASSYITHPRQVAPSNDMLLPNTNSIFFLASSHIYHPLQVVSSNIMLFLNTKHSRSLPVVDSHTLLFCKTNRASFVTVSHKTKFLKCKTNSTYSLICLLFLCRVFLLCTNHIACGACHRITNISP